MARRVGAIDGNRLGFDKRVRVLVFGFAYEWIADKTGSATTLRHRRDEWLGAGVMTRLKQVARDGYDRMVGLELATCRWRAA